MNILLVEMVEFDSEKSIKEFLNIAFSPCVCAISKELHVIC